METIYSILCFLLAIRQKDACVIFVHEAGDSRVLMLAVQNGEVFKNSPTYLIFYCITVF